VRATPVSNPAPLHGVRPPSQPHFLALAPRAGADTRRRAYTREAFRRRAPGGTECRTRCPLGGKSGRGRDPVGLGVQRGQRLLWPRF
jgi:hypothetical protein